MFNWLVHSKTRLKMMKMFFKEPTAALYGLEIAQALKASPGTTHRELNALLKQGIISKKKEGALVLYRLNHGHPYFHELKKAVFPNKKTDRVLFISDLHLSLDSEANLMEDLLLFCEYAEENASEVVLLGDILELLKGNIFQAYLFYKPLFERLVHLTQEVKVTYIVGNHDAFFELFCHEGPSGKFLGMNIDFAQEYYNNKLNIYALHGHQYDNWEGVKMKKAEDSNGAELLKKLKNLDREGFSLHQNQLLEVAEYADKALQYATSMKGKKSNMNSTLQKAAKDLIKEEEYSYVVFGHAHKAALKQMGHGIYFNPGSWKSEKKRQFVEIDKDGGALIALDELR